MARQAGKENHQNSTNANDGHSQSGRSKPDRRNATRRRYTEAERHRILETASREGLTGTQVRDRFGVSTLSFYLWRKRASASARQTKGRFSRQNLLGDISRQIRDAVRAELETMLPEIIAQELGATMGTRSKGGR